MSKEILSAAKDDRLHILVDALTGLPVDLIQVAVILGEGQGIVMQQRGGVAHRQVEAARNSGEGDGGAETPGV